MITEVDHSHLQYRRKLKEYIASFNNWAQQQDGFIFGSKTKSRYRPGFFYPKIESILPSKIDIFILGSMDDPHLIGTIDISKDGSDKIWIETLEEKKKDILGFAREFDALFPELSINIIYR